MLSPTEAFFRRFAGWVKDRQLSSLPIFIWHDQDQDLSCHAFQKLFWEEHSMWIPICKQLLPHILRNKAAACMAALDWIILQSDKCFPSSLHIIDDRKENHVRFIIIVLILLQFKVVYTYADHPNDAYAVSWVCDWVLFHLVGHNQHIQPHL